MYSYLKHDSPVTSTFRAVKETTVGLLAFSTELSDCGDFLVAGLFPGVVNKLSALDTDLSIVLARSEININSLKKYIPFGLNCVTY